MTLAATVTIGVFGLFHPHSLDIEPFGSSRVQLNCGPAFHRTLEGSARIRLTSDCAMIGPADFVLSVPGRIRRHYQGTLVVKRLASGELAAAVTMELEMAVASTIAAEAPSDAPASMLEAQAIVTRSYFIAGRGRHKNFDFCDTTHCQFVKAPPLAESPAARAARATAGQVLVYLDRPIAAFYASRCNGLLGPLPPARIAQGAYPYFAVRCDYCRRNPSKASLKSNARPHHHGMCQLGAIDFARHGATAWQVLAHYYPGTELRSIQSY